MYLKIFINIFLLIMISIIQLSFVNALSGVFVSINIVVVAIVFIVGLNRFSTWLWWVFGFALFFDIYSFLPFGFHLVLFPIISVIINYVLVNYLTDRSLYSFVVIFFLFISLYKISLFLVYSFFSFFNEKILFNFSFTFSDFMAGFFINFIVIVIVYAFMNVATNILKPVFLVGR